MRSSTKLLLALCLIVVALGVAASLTASVVDLYDRIASQSRPLAISVFVLVAIATVAAAATSARILWRLGRPERPPPQAPEDVIKAADLQAEKAEAVVEQVADATVKETLRGELAELRADRSSQTFHLVVFGTGSAGKTSIINALLGQSVGKTEATLGTTKHGERHTLRVEGVEGTLIVTDTPGLSEIGEGGTLREAEARDLAARADLLLFVVDHDLVRSEFDPLAALARQGKRSIVVLNKDDRFVEADRHAILQKLRERLAGVVPRDDIVSAAASPRPVPTRVQAPDGTFQTILEVEPPDLDALRDRIAAVIEREGDALRAGNLLLRAHLISRSAQEQVTKERRVRARAVVDRFQWITAGTVFANPIPALDLMATGAVQFQMIAEIAGSYGVELTAGHVRMIGGQMVQLLLKLGMVEAASSLIAGVFKSTLVGFAAGGAVQATTMAYLTHVSGLAFVEYFERGQSWGDGGMQAALVRQFNLNSRAEFLQEFARQALDRVVRRATTTREAAGNAPGGGGGSR